jgi:hypothetical protein
LTPATRESYTNRIVKRILILPRNLNRLVMAVFLIVPDTVYTLSPLAEERKGF